MNSEASGMELGASSKRPASVVGLLDRRYDKVLKSVDAEDDAAARKSFVKWQRKEYRTVQNELIRLLDEALPQDFDRAVPGKLSAGPRALGRSGRMLHLRGVHWYRGYALSPMHTPGDNFECTPLLTF